MCFQELSEMNVRLLVYNSHNQVGMNKISETGFWFSCGPIFSPILRLSGNKISPKGTEKETLHSHHWYYPWVFSFPVLLFQVGGRMSSTSNRPKLVFPPTEGKRIDGSSLADHVRCLHTPSTLNRLWKGTSTKCLATAVVGLCQWTQFSSH